MSRDLVNLRCKTPVQRRSKSASTESASHLPTTADAAGRTSSDPLPPQSQSVKRLADAARRIELLVGYTRKEAAPFAAMNPRIARAKRLGPPGGILERAAAAAMTRLVLSAPARRLAKTWQRYCGRSATIDSQRACAATEAASRKAVWTDSTRPGCTSISSRRHLAAGGKPAAPVAAQGADRTKSRPKCSLGKRGVSGHSGSIAPRNRGFSAPPGSAPRSVARIPPIAVGNRPRRGSVGQQRRTSRRHLRSP